jgi:Asp-tRNA(Asn)/Glu-tRNA(Gln) amidotransferase C subunit
MTELPEATIDSVERLTRLARNAVDPAEADAYRQQRASILTEYGYTARVREEDTGDVLVCYPDEWVVDGVVRPDHVNDTDRGIEIRLSGPGNPDEWADVEAENSAVVEELRDEHGDVHAETARVLADFMGNHYAKPIAEITPEELSEFRKEYVPRNAWLTDDQRSALDTSIRLTIKHAGGRLPEEYDENESKSV